MRLALASSLALTLAGCDRPPAAPEAAPVTAPPAAAGRVDRSHAGAPAPSTPFEDPEGEPATLADFRGRPLLVNFWATWCAPCIAELPTLDALAALGGPVQVLAVSQDMEGRRVVDAFFDKLHFRRLQPYIDPEMALMDALKLQSLPTTILYDAAGREIWRLTGDADWTGPQAARLLAEAAEARR